MKKRIAVDMDQVLGDIMSPWLEQYNEDYNDTLKPEDITAWNWHEVTHPSCQKRIYKYLDNPNLFRTLPVIEDSQKVLEMLSKKYEIYIVSAVYNPFNIPPKVEWLNKYYPFLDEEKFVFTRDKSIVLADYLIDDKAKNLETFRGNKLLFSAPHNKTENRFYRVNSWQDIRRYFLKEHLEFNTFDKARLVENKHTKFHHPDQIGKQVDILTRLEGEFDYMVMLSNSKIDFIKAKDIENFKE